LIGRTWHSHLLLIAVLSAQPRRVHFFDFSSI